MKLSYSWLIPIFVFLLLLYVPRAYAQPWFAVYPTLGTVDTEIYLEIRGLPNGPYYNSYDVCYLVWDNVLIGTYYSAPSYNQYFDIYFFPPSDTYVSEGNHTVYFEVWNDGRTGMFINATFVFTITEPFLGPEYSALNSTYYGLLASHKSLNASYSALLNQYNDLNNTYQELQTDYTTKLAHYDSLSNSYDSLCTQYDSLDANYNSLQSDYNSLQSNNGKLATSFNDLVGELTSTRYLGYLFITTTMILIATTVYFAFTKPKVKTT